MEQDSIQINQDFLSFPRFWVYCVKYASDKLTLKERHYDFRSLTCMQPSSSRGRSAAIHCGAHWVPEVVSQNLAYSGLDMTSSLTDSILRQSQPR